MHLKRLTLQSIVPYIQCLFVIHSSIVCIYNLPIELRKPTINVVGVKQKPAISKDNSESSR